MSCLLCFELNVNEFKNQASLTDLLFRCRTMVRRDEIQSELQAISDSATLARAKDDFARHTLSPRKKIPHPPYEFERHSSVLFSTSKLRYELAVHNDGPPRMPDPKQTVRQRATLMWLPRDRGTEAVRIEINVVE